MKHVISVLIRLLYGRVLGAQTLTLLSFFFYGSLCVYPNWPAVRVSGGNWVFADRRSQINSLNSCCATRVSKTLDVVHGYALLVNNSDML